MSKSYEIVVLGGGIGGYTAAIRAAQLGKRVALVEKEKLGGTCLHRGCIPTKALLRSAEVCADLREAGQYGIEAEGFRVNMGKVQERKTRIVEQLYKGVQFLMKKNKIDVYAGTGRLIGPSIFSPRAGSVAVELADGETETLVPEHLILATGSRPRLLPGLVPDGERILTSDEALELQEVPQSVIIVGGGVIGCEFASLLADFGAEVTIVEYADRLLPQEDKEVSAELARRFKKDRVRLLTGARVLAETVRTEGAEVRLRVESAAGELELAAAVAIVAVGRIGNTEGIGLENTDIVVDRGFIRTDDYMQTALGHIYAVGDVNGKLQLAHAAAHQGITAVERIAGLGGHPFRLREVPRCVYTRLQVACIGESEQEALDAGRRVKIGKFPFKALGKALVQGETGGFVKVVADADTNDLLGVHMVGSHVTELIGEASLAGLVNASAWEVGQAIHPHPTLSKALAEAMLAVEGSALNL
jgi:dihydrolipoamide dehydrogenase